MGTSTIDLIVIVSYLVGIMLIGLLAVRNKTINADEYFLAGRTLGWPVVGSALFAANISTIHLVGLAEGGYKHGLVIGNFEWMATLTLILLALVFVPFYFRSQITTLPEYLKSAYSRFARTLMAIMAIVAALLIHIGISLYAGAAVFKEFFGLNVTASIVTISAVTAHLHGDRRAHGRGRHRNDPDGNSIWPGRAGDGVGDTGSAEGRRSHACRISRSNRPAQLSMLHATNKTASPGMRSCWVIRCSAFGIGARTRRSSSGRWARGTRTTPRMGRCLPDC